ncbi:MAG: hypothetical protein HY689_14545 [Chloroflexi bacterium]|nr:hypothetical protein [Chloroflexota bacterium]
MRVTGPAVALIVVGLVVAAALLVATTGRRVSLESVAFGSGAAREIVRDNVYQLATCDPREVAQTLQALSRSYRILGLTATALPCDQLWIIVEPY